MNLETAYNYLGTKYEDTKFLAELTKQAELRFDLGLQQTYGSLWRDDVAQVFAINMYSAIDKLRGFTLTEFSKYAYVVYTRTASRILRNESHEELLESHLEDMIEDGPEDKFQESAILEESLEPLKKVPRQIILARLLTNRSFESIGKQLGISEHATRKAYQRALEVLNERRDHTGVS